MAVFDEGSGAQLYAGGGFNTIGGIAADGIAKWNGSAWSALGVGFASGSAPNGNVRAIAAVDEGQGPVLYAAGMNLSVGGTALGTVARWKPCVTPAQITPFCFGDGSLATPCPCAQPDYIPNPSGASDAGCANSYFLSGAKLVARGTTSPDTIELEVSQVPPTYCLFLVGDGASSAGIASGDGVRCASGALVRFGGQLPGCDARVLYPRPDLGFTLPVSTVGGTPPGSGATGYYQVFYRNAYPTFCSPGTTNLTNACRIVWN